MKEAVPDLGEAPVQKGEQSIRIPLKPGDTAGRQKKERPEPFLFLSFTAAAVAFQKIGVQMVEILHVVA